MFKTLKPKQGSVLVFSLIVLSILLSAAVAVATVSVANRRSTFSTAKSSQSFQVADSGAELVLQQIYKTVPTHASISALAAALGGGAACSGGAITKNGVAGGDIKVSFYDKDNNLISCTDTAWRSKVVAIKSEGTTAGTTRLVETAVAAGSDFGWVNLVGGPHSGGTTVRNATYDYYVSWSDPGDHSATKICQDAGYIYYTGACRSQGAGAMSAYYITGSVIGARNISGTGSWLSCLSWAGTTDSTSYFNVSSSSEILCAK
jgi:Tfp pilus assembly protein PilX